MGKKIIDFAAHFWARCAKGDGCWEWQASKTHWGYGQVFRDGRMVSAHRTAYLLAKGSIPSGMHVLHSCDNRCCVNPAHLRVGSHQENMADMVSRGRQGSNNPEDVAVRAQRAAVRTQRKQEQGSRQRVEREALAATRVEQALVREKQAALLGQLIWQGWPVNTEQGRQQLAAHVTAYFSDAT